MYTISLFILIIVFLVISGKTSRQTEFLITPFCLSLEYTNTLRGLAMVMIMYGHICGRYHESVWFSPFACTGVALFLFLSGYGNSESFFKNKSFPFSRVLKIIVPYWIVILITNIVKYKDFSLTQFILDISFIRTSYWFVGYILIWYVVYWFAINYLYRYRWFLFALMSIMSFVFLSPLESEQSLSFVMGIYVSEHKESIFEISNKRLNLIALGFFLWATVFLAVKQLSSIRENDVLMNIVQLQIKITYALALIISLRYIKWLNNNQNLLKLSRMTYELYLSHMIFINYIFCSNIWLTVISTSLVIIVSIMVSSVFKKANVYILSFLVK